MVPLEELEQLTKDLQEVHKELLVLVQPIPVVVVVVLVLLVLVRPMEGPVVMVGQENLFL